MKTRKYDWYLASMCLCLFFAVVSVVLALCLFEVIAAAVALAFWVAYIVIYCVAKHRSSNSQYFEQSLSVTFASIVLVAISPIALIAWGVEELCEFIAAKRAN